MKTKINESISGRKVSKLYVGWGEAQDLYDFNKPGMEAVVVNTFHGNHDFDWVVVLQDGVEVRRIGINQNCNIEWCPLPDEEGGKA